MAFDSTGWNCVNASKSGNAPGVYTYSTADAAADVNTAGYFNALSDTLKVGDIIMAYTDNDGTPSLVVTYVNANASGVVDIADGTAISATDTD